MIFLIKKLSNIILYFDRLDRKFFNYELETKKGILFFWISAIATVLISIFSFIRSKIFTIHISNRHEYCKFCHSKMNIQDHHPYSNMISYICTSHIPIYNIAYYYYNDIDYSYSFSYENIVITELSWSNKIFITLSEGSEYFIDKKIFQKWKFSNIEDNVKKYMLIS